MNSIIGFSGQDADFDCRRNSTSVLGLSVGTTESWKNSPGEG